ncbi:zinc-containing alcohol dehydrogenase, putative [Talaromyces stipitatus ATCC 10500]|uniref:Zinc-containing alcohol dehydrogenase, putative n=1 Tax=Talaromyces stipitatus (strain ATCC 10500 / CBS 375.48 / QM 6759 / NRRL 1006) TaxID=441959 RepID=B8M197_TALSN|nr:zinc-containing alcohol dehydrogenase, putative [Talaromyces stipitatus ATCC 10500]EED21039.1 zinc-containing alcohol dehydrogenase, putative [Talaromyces stipitatus ATCC 10500]
MVAKTIKQWTVTGDKKGFDELKLEVVDFPKCGENEVVVKLNAASLNYRDLIIPQGKYPFPLGLPVVACSDGAGEVVEVGSKVRQWKKGDKVVTLFNQGHQYGPMTTLASKTGLGGVLDGTLREYGVFNENGLVRQPNNLSAIEASTLSCAALTAWNALYGSKPLKPGQTVLVLGTGGVSMFGLQFARAAGAKVIATTSSDAKAEKLRKLGADHVINYKTDPNWGETARKLSMNGEGVDHILEVGGPATLKQTVKAIKYEGILSIIGFVGGENNVEVPQIVDALSNICTFRGVYVGSKEQMEDMVNAIEANDIHPVVDDEVFEFEKAKEAYHYQWDQRHFGKVVIKI